MFSLAGQCYGLRFDIVDRVLRAVAILALPHAPPIIRGVINVRGKIIPVADIRARFDLPVHGLSTRDQFIIAHTRRRMVALLVDDIGEIVDCPIDAVSPADQILPDLPYVSGVAKLPDGAVIIHDIDGFLSLEEEAQLENALISRSGERDAR